MNSSLCKEHPWHFTGYPGLAVLSWFDIRFFDLIFNISSFWLLEYQVPAETSFAALKSIWQWFRHSTCRDLKDSEGKVHGPMGCLKGSAKTCFSQFMRDWTFSQKVTTFSQVCSGEYWSFRKQCFQVSGKLILHTWFCTHLFRSPGPQGYDKDREVMPWISSRSHQVLNLWSPSESTSKVLQEETSPDSS